jgi:ATP-binding cassette subfamily B protein
MRRWARLLALAEPRPRSVVLVGLLSVGAVGVELAKPWPLKLVLDSALAGRPLPSRAAWLAALPGARGAAGLLAWLCAGALGLAAAAWLLRAAQSYLQAGAGARMTQALTARAFDRAQSLSPAARGRRTTGDVIKRVTDDAACARTLVYDVGVPLLGAVLALVGTFAVMWRLDPVLALLAAAAGPLFGVCLRLYARPMEQASYEQFEVQGRILAAAEQTLTALPIVRAFGREEHEDERFSALVRLGDRAYVRTLMAQLRFKFSAGAVTALGTAAVIAVGGAHVLAGRISPGTLLVFVSYLAALYAPLETLAYLSDSVAAASASGRRLLELFDEPDLVADGAREAPALPPGRGARIRFEDVTFAYGPGASVLEGVSLEAAPGETIALVGVTGAGKSTLVSLVPRFADPLHGRVLYEGVDVRTLRLASLRARISVVHQEPVLLPLTVAENIRYGRPEASDDEVRAAAAAANADAFIRRLPGGYETPVVEGGATLSGGERQRLAIARALLKDAPVLILDEPTSALDVETEALVMEALARLGAGRTTFVIAHRLSTVRRADRVVVLDRGRVVEEGPHDALVARGGLYARLCEAALGGAPRLEERA